MVPVRQCVNSWAHTSRHWAKSFAELDRIDPADYPAIHDALYAAMGGSSYLEEAEERTANLKQENENA